RLGSTAQITYFTRSTFIFSMLTRMVGTRKSFFRSQHPIPAIFFATLFFSFRIPIFRLFRFAAETTSKRAIALRRISHLPVCAFSALVGQGFVGQADTHEIPLLDTPPDPANMFRMNRRPRHCSQGRILLANRGTE